MAPAHPPTPSAVLPAQAAVPATAPTGAQIQLVPADAATALARADDSVDLLLDSGRAPEQILVLTTGAGHPWQQHEESFGADGYWAQLAAAEDVFYADAARCRPVRREVVVLALNADAPAADAVRALAAALDRATRLVVVCGDASAVAGLPTN
ncbi:hypothetical protein [Streptacidiphilus cavernicola]|uniref:Uncharacterized protein n=1 Tax=Streptacidiphilus cavernicola TaxID=3342716 RepID=A0ABV6W1J9_9ACTN